MVKVYKCHNFKSQNVIQVDNEPVALFAHQDKLFVATQNCCVFIYKFLANQKHQKTNAFATEARAQQLLFNNTGNYVATLEVKYSRRQTFYAVKVYLNWQLATDANSTRSCVRLANHDHSLKLSSLADDQLQVIDIPCSKEVTCISSCQKTGNLVIVQREKTTFYQVVEKSFSNSEKTYVDVVVFLELDWSFVVRSISFCENYVAVASEEEAQVVRLLYAETNKQTEDTDILKQFPSVTRRRVSSVLSKLSIGTDKDRHPDSFQSHTSKHGLLGSSRSSINASPALSASSLNKFGFDAFNKIDDDENFVTWNFDETDEKVDFDGGSFLGRRGVKKRQSKTVVLKTLQEIAQRDLLLADIPKHEDLRGGGHSTLGDLTVATVLYKRSSSTTDSWKYIQLQPTYLSDNVRPAVSDWYREIPVQSSVYSSLIGMSCLLSSSRVGTMYNLWAKTSEISHYKYTSDAHQLITDGNLLYIMNEKGLEIYSSRCNAAAIHNTEDWNGITKAYPSANLEICLLGAHPFIGATQITLADNAVILLSKVETSSHQNDESIWSLYALGKCTVSELFKDMVNYGTRNTNSVAHLHMLQESHMIIRNALIGQHAKDEHLLDLYRESCGLLGEYYSKPDAENFKMCLPYYLMSGLSISDIVHQAVIYKQQSKKTTPYCYGKGFSYFLNYVLFQDEEPFNILEVDGDQILEVCEEVIPDRISEVILFSRLQTYTPEVALKILQTQMKHRSSIDEKHSPVDMVALACLHLKLCDPEPAHVALASIPQRELTKICICHHQLLHQDFTELSPLSQLMRCHCPQVLITSMVALHDTGMISLDLAIRLLQGKQEEDTMFRNNHIKEYLEKILEDNQRKYAFEDAAILLCEMYVKRIIHEIYPTEKQRLSASAQCKTTGYFGSRFSWLDDLPPFKGVFSVRQPCLYLRSSSPTTARKTHMAAPTPTISKQGTCSCALCHEDLVKLQSMLCSACCSETVVTRVLSLLETSTSIIGWDALWMLCKIRSKVTDTFKVLVQKYPAVILSYGTSVLGSDPGLWSNYLNEVVQMNKMQAESPDENAEIFFKSFQGILKHLTDVLELKDFLQILPDEGNMLFFLPYITECQEKEKSKQLLNIIRKKGEHLQHYI